MQEFYINQDSNFFYYRIPSKDLVDKIKAVELTEEEKRYQDYTVTGETVRGRIKCTRYVDGDLFEIKWILKQTLDLDKKRKLEEKINRLFKVSDLEGVYPTYIKYDKANKDYSMINIVYDITADEVVKVYFRNNSSGIGIISNTDKAYGNNRLSQGLSFTQDGNMASKSQLLLGYRIKTKEDSNMYLVQQFKNAVLNLNKDDCRFFEVESPDSRQTAPINCLCFSDSNHMYNTERIPHKRTMYTEILLARSRSSVYGNKIRRGFKVHEPTSSELITRSTMWDIVKEEFKGEFQKILSL